jgi:hypothetical protein
MPLFLVGRRNAQNFPDRVLKRMQDHSIKPVSIDHFKGSIRHHPILTFLVLTACFFLLRSLVTFPVEHGDALAKYDVAAQIARDGDWRALLQNHQTMRWIQTVPQTVITWLTRHRYGGMYLLPLLVFGAYCALMIMAAQEHLDVGQQLLLATLLFIEPIAMNHTGQLLNPPFGVLLAFSGMLILTRPRTPGIAATILAAVFFFGAYGAQVTYLGFAFGAFIWLWLNQRKLLLPLVFAGALLCLFVTETLVFNHLSGGELTLGRIEALSEGGHVQRVKHVFQPSEPEDLLFRRWISAPLFDQVMLLGFLALAALSIFRRKRANKVPQLFLIVILSAAGYAFLITFAVTSVFPPRPLVPILTMYLEPLMPFAILASVFLYAQFEACISPRLVWPARTAAAGTMSILFLALVMTKGPLKDTLNNRLNAFFWKSDAALTEYSEKMRNGELIVRGYNQHPYYLLARYKRPFEHFSTGWAQGTSAVSPRSDALCFFDLRKIPLYLNYHDCES